MIPPPYSEFPEILSEDILLREITTEDVPALVSISYYDGNKAANEAEATMMLKKIEQDYILGNSIHWGIEEKSSGKIVGTCGYYRGFKNDSGELGGILLDEYRGKGFMSQAMRLAIAFGFKKGLKRIFALTSNENISAIKLLERLNFRRTGEEDHEVHYAIFREELFSIRAFRNDEKEEILKLLRLNTPKSFHPSEEKDLREYLENEAENYFVVDGPGGIVAAGGYNTGFDNGRAVRISWDLVHPEFQGLGIGKNLTLYRIEQIKKNPDVEMIVVRTTGQAEKFYENMGFQKRHFEKDFWAPGFDLYQMEMRIKKGTA
jgi:ribosomal-protein-alanine N-acetyltransferase